MITSYKTKEEMFSALKKEYERQNEIAKELLAAQPHLGISAYIIAGDMLSAEKATQLVKEGTNPEQALNFVGSYARFDWAVNNLSMESFMKMLPELWRGADPDDTNATYLTLWREAWRRNKRKPVCDEKKLKGTKKFVIYRGQAENAPVGFAWTLDYEIAKKFALSGGLRGTILNGKILKGLVDPRNVLAYITGRGESEIIVDPKNVKLL